MKIRKFVVWAMVVMLPIAVFSKSSLKTLVLGDDIVLEPESSLTFTLAGDLEDLAFPYELLPFSPDGVDVEWTGKKFKTPKAGKVKYIKSDEDFGDFDEPGAFEEVFEAYRDGTMEGGVLQ